MALLLALTCLKLWIDRRQRGRPSNRNTPSTDSFSRRLGA
jgi:hypothetical protein